MWIYSYGKMGNQTVQLVVQHCCKMSSKAPFLVLITTFKPVLHQIRSLQVVRVLTSDWIKLLGSHAIHRIYVTCWKTNLFGPVKRATCTHFVAKRRTTPFFASFRNLQHPDLLQDSSIRWVVKRATWLAVQLFLKQCCKRRCTFLLLVLLYLNPWSCALILNWATLVVS